MEDSEPNLTNNKAFLFLFLSRVSTVNFFLPSFDGSPESSLTRATLPTQSGLVSPGGSDQAQLHYP